MAPEQPSLFAAPRHPLAERLERLAAEGIYFGTSSWKYDGWLGDIYARDRYVTRGRFSQKRFEAECLAEYAEIFPIVCGDFSFYQFPTEAYWLKLFSSAPGPLRFAFKVPEMITVRRWPAHARYGDQGCKVNEFFLNAEVFESQFLQMLAPYGERVVALIFEFGTFGKSQYPDVEAFAADLDPFLAQLPPSFRYAVEIRNAEFFAPPHFEILRAHRVAHVFNSWTRMPDLTLQVREPLAFTTDFVLARALLRPGRSYEEAVQKFQPYASLQQPHPPARLGLKQLAEMAKAAKKPSYLFVNNRLEGNAPGTIQAVTEDLEAEQNG